MLRPSSNEKSQTITKDPFIFEIFLSNVMNLFLILSAISTLTPDKSAIKFVTFFFCIRYSKIVF